EPQPSDLDPQDRASDLRGDVGGAQERAVTADGDHEVDVGDAPIEVGGLDAVGGERPAQAGRRLDGGRPPRVDHEPDGAHRASSRRAWMAGSGSRGPGASREVRCKRNSTLPAGPRTGDAITARGCKPSARAAVATSPTARRHTCGSRTTPPSPTSSRRASNWG